MGVIGVDNQPYGLEERGERRERMILFFDRRVRIIEPGAARTRNNKQLLFHLILNN